MKLLKPLIVFVVIASISIGAYFIYQKLKFVQPYSSSQSYIIQLNKFDITDDFLLYSIGKDNIREYSENYIRINGTTEIEQKLVSAGIKYIFIPNDFPISNNHAMYIVKINDNYIEPKLQEISRLGIFIHKRYDWGSKNFLNSTALMWATPEAATQMASVQNVEYVSQYNISDRIEPQLVSILEGGNSAVDINLQIYDLYKYRKELKNDPFYKELKSLGIEVNGEPKLITVDSGGILKEYIIYADMNKLMKLLSNNPEVVRVFK